MRYYAIKGYEHMHIFNALQGNFQSSRRAQTAREISPYLTCRSIKLPTYWCMTRCSSTSRCPGTHRCRTHCCLTTRIQFYTSHSARLHTRMVHTEDQEPHCQAPGLHRVSLIWSQVICIYIKELIQITWLWTSQIFLYLFSA